MNSPLRSLSFALVLAAAFQITAVAQVIPPPEVNWQRFALSIAAHGAGTGFDSWTSWQHLERNRFLAHQGRFTATSAGKKAGAFAAITLAQVVVVKKWGKKHPWLEKAFSIANFTSAGMYAGAGFRNIGVANAR